MILALKGVVNGCLKMGDNLKKDWIFKCYQEPGLVEAANAWLWSNIPIAVPTAIVIAKPIANVASFGCADIAFRSFYFIDMLLSRANNLQTPRPSNHQEDPIWPVCSPWHAL
jgi:hypothetical protein